MDSIVREAWFGILEKRFRAEKKILKNTIRVPKDLRHIILAYSRIDPGVLTDLEAVELHYRAKYPAINDGTELSAYISHIKVIEIIDSESSSWSSRCSSSQCRKLSPHIGIHINFPENEDHNSLMILKLSALFEYILVGSVVDLDEHLLRGRYFNPQDVDMNRVSDIIKPLFDMIIWPIIPLPPFGMSYSGYEICDCER